LDKFIPKIPILAIFGAVSPHCKREICEIWHDGVGLGLPPHTKFCKKNIPKFTILAILRL